MKYTLFTVLALISFKSFALDPDVIAADLRKAPVYHPTCKIFYAPFEERAANRDLERILKEKGYEPLNAVKELKEFKKGLGYMLSGDEGRARRRREHSVRNCEKAQDNLSLNFEVGTKDENTAFFAMEISRLEKTDCQKKDLDEDIPHEIVRNLPTEFPVPTPSPDESLKEAAAKKVTEIANKTFEEFPPCIKREDLTYEVSPVTAPLAPPPVIECEDGSPGCYRGQRYEDTKDINRIESEHWQRVNSGAIGQ